MNRNMRTEAEAQALWCPKSSVAMWEQAGGANRDFDIRDPDRSPAIPLGSTCIGSRCMWWLWAGGPQRRFVRAEPPGVVIEPVRPEGVGADWEWHGYDVHDPAFSTAGWWQTLAAAEAERLGFCGGMGILP